MVESMMQVQLQTARFGLRRMDRSLCLPAKLLGCRSPGEAQDVQQAYLRDLRDDCATTWATLVQSSVQVAMGHPVGPPPQVEDEHHATPI
ncbi:MULTISPECIES: hypothetical protein [Jannaschia]|uniref:hypothetical protein n=1 Tax=Jannaschia TaxID=188905 RepID=UPI001C7CE9C5|nr:MULTISPECIES: hypothetical protein [unclassified Jannaschia]